MSLVSFVGAGGKTSVMLALQRELLAARIPVALTTTTKIWPPPGTPLVIATTPAAAAPAVRDVLTSAGTAVVAGVRTPEGKLVGIEPDTLCRLRPLLPGVVLLCEADGAAGKPLKAHASHEPVVPRCTTHVVIVAGLDAIGSPVARSVHRPEVFCRALGIDLSTPISPFHLSAAIRAAARYAPSDARVAVVLNKAETDERLSWARRVREELAAAYPVIATKHGTPVLHLAPI
jgi:probable selenium-dependent hydroxylase accessory protein YqeC